MPHCDTCHTETDLSFDKDVGKVLCATCIPPTVTPTADKPKVEYGLHYTNVDGLRAELKVGELALEVHYTPKQIGQALGRRG